jgi:hydroxymethylpyrimidine/phosphomethylpyrimidine kinase
VQDSHNVYQLIPLSAQQISQQVAPVLADLHPKVIKLGLLGSIEVMDAVMAVLRQHPDLPVVLDPILAAGGGKDFSQQDLITHMRENLVPLTTIITPNSEEARRLTGESQLDKAAEVLLQQGCSAVLITGTHENSPEVSNCLYQAQKPPQILHWPRLAGSYHGSGCTLSSAIAAYLAHGFDLNDATKKAQAYTWHSLQAGYRLGQGQFFPQRRVSCNISV